MCIRKIGTKRRRRWSLLLAAFLLLTQMPVDSVAAGETVSADGESLESSTNESGDTVNTLLTLKLGLPASTIREMFGAPTRQELSERGYTWLVYPDKSQYQLFGVDDEELLQAVYLHRGNWKLSCGLKQGMNQAECRNILGLGYQVEDYDAFCCYLGTEELYTVFFDAERIAYAVLWEDIAYMGQFMMSDAVLAGFSNEFYELMNVERYQHGLTPLPLDIGVCQVAAAHAADMAQQSTMGHIGSDGKSAKQRLLDAGVDADYESECVASAYPNALCAFCGLMQQSNYLPTITSCFTSAGVGIAYLSSSDGVLYYVQQLVKSET